MTKQCDYVMYSTKDPQTNLPALTTLLYKVCDQSQEKFEEACRLVELFVDQALKEKTE